MSLRKLCWAAVALGVCAGAVSADPMRTVFTKENKFPEALRGELSVAGGGSSYDGDRVLGDVSKYYVAPGARFGLADRVELAGWLASADFFRRVHVLVQCSQVENQPLSVLEAMAWMRPTIATRAGGLPELVQDGETGSLVPKGRARALAAAMKECLVAPEKAHAAGLRARDRLERDYSFERMVRDHVGLYAAERRG